MINQVKLPSKDDLKDLINEALSNGEVSQEEFISKHCEGLATVLERNPDRYRSYGAYWWAVKDILNEQGYGALVGVEVEELTAKHFYIEDDVTTLCAAWQYHNMVCENGLLGMGTSQAHIYAIEQDGELEPFEYQLSDDFMEAKILGLA